jgi:hypothetical protein
MWWDAAQDFEFVIARRISKQENRKGRFAGSHQHVYILRRYDILHKLTFGVHNLWILALWPLSENVRLQHIVQKYIWAQLTPLSWALFEKPPVAQLLKYFPIFYRIWRFITVFTRPIHWSPSWARSIQSIPLDHIFLRSILILSSHLRLRLHSCQFTSGFPTNILYAFLLSQSVLHTLSISFPLTWSF